MFSNENFWTTENWKFSQLWNRSIRSVGIYLLNFEYCGKARQRVWKMKNYSILRILEIFISHVINQNSKSMQCRWFINFFQLKIWLWLCFSYGNNLNPESCSLSSPFFSESPPTIAEQTIDLCTRMAIKLFNYSEHYIQLMSLWSQALVHIFFPYQIIHNSVLNYSRLNVVTFSKNWPLSIVDLKLFICTTRFCWWLNSCFVYTENRAYFLHM